MNKIDPNEKVDLNDIYGKRIHVKAGKGLEEAYHDIMQIVCKHCPECTYDCPIGHKIWKFVKGEL